MSSRSVYCSRYPLLALLIFAAIFTGPGQVSALTLTYESFVGIDPSEIAYSGSVPSGQFGSTLASGDINGDGIGDLVVGSPFASTRDKEWNGIVEIILGSNDQDKLGNDFYSSSEKIMFSGAAGGDQLGTSLAVGDFNNDGFDDIAMGAYKALSMQKRTGRVYIIYGEANLEIQSRDFALKGADSIISGTSENEGFGMALKAVDFNRDQIDDLLVGSPMFSVDETKKIGAVYLYIGSSGSLGTSAQKTFYGQNENERFGSVIAAGQISGDESVDLAIGAYFAHGDMLSQSGKVYYFEGDSVLADTVKIPSLIFGGQNDREWFGFDIETNNLNGDDFEDLVISSFPYNGSKESAKVFAYYGAEILTNQTPDIIIGEPINDSLIGGSLLLHDLNSDKVADIIIGAPGISGGKTDDEGDVYIFNSDTKRGFDSGYSIDKQDVGTIINGEKAEDWFGSALAALDINADGFEDLAVGSRYSDTSNTINNGKVFIILGNGEPLGNLKPALSRSGEEVSRGELVKLVMDNFELRNKKSDYIENCYSHMEFCLFNFMAMSSYSDLKLGPETILYPDVKPGDQYFEEINLATILGVVNGYMDDKDSPFRPDEPISRIQALKIVMGAADLVPTKYKFELIASLGSYENLTSQISPFEDVDSRIDHMWWYPRYLNFALESGIIAEGKFFRPDENISTEELNALIYKTIQYINNRDEETES